MCAERARLRRAAAALFVTALAGVAVTRGMGHAALPASCYQISADTVVDSRSTLSWQRVVGPDAFTWAEAQAHCAALQLSGGGWRVPSVKELTTIVDFTRFDPAVDATLFPDTPSEFFWSSSAVPGNSDKAWGVSFTRGSGGVASTDSASRVRCVR